MGVIKKFMFQGILEIDSQACKDEKEVQEFVEKCLKKVIYPEQQEKVEVRRVERI